MFSINRRQKIWNSKSLCSTISKTKRHLHLHANYYAQMNNVPKRPITDDWGFPEKNYVSDLRKISPIKHKLTFLLLHSVIVMFCICIFLPMHNYVSQFTVETYCFADGRCLFKQPQSVLYHWNQYDEEISKKCRSVRPFVCPL